MFVIQGPSLWLLFMFAFIELHALSVCMFKSIKYKLRIHYITVNHFLKCIKIKTHSTTLCPVHHTSVTKPFS